MIYVSLDFETRSVLDLKRVGAWRYASDRSTVVLCLVWRVADDARVWVPMRDPPPDDLIRLAEEAAQGRAVFCAWNVAFEWAIWHLNLRPRLGGALPEVPRSSWRCTMTEALMQGWPGKLEMAAKAMNLTGKDKRGEALLRRCGATGERFNAVDFQALVEYCVQDTAVEANVRKRLIEYKGPWTARERKIELLDHEINRRGVRVDLSAAKAVLSAVEEATAKSNALLASITGGIVTSATQAARLREWAAGQGVPLPDLTAGTVERALARDDLPQHVRSVLTIRASAGGSAVKKLHPLLEVPDPVDWRARGLLQYHGAAATGRWAGRLIQPQNFPRPLLKGVDGEELIETFVSGRALERWGSDIFSAASDALRPLITATPGNRLVRADLSAIEARLVLWLAGHTDAMALFKTGTCIYCEMASAVYGRAINKTEHPEERFVGKVIVLGCGYQMGPARFLAHAESVGLTITEQQAEEYVNAYRRRWWRVPKLWAGLERACFEAARTGRQTSYGGVDFATRNGAILCRLPSGRVLTWQDAQIAPGRFGTEQVSVRRVKEGRWERVDLYGGIITERVTQALARDVLAEAILRAEAAGLNVVLTVHDEIVCDTDAQDAEARLTQCLTEPPQWAPDLPLAAEATASFRYGK